MATLAALEAAAAGGTLTGTEDFKRWIVALGPLKLELIYAKQDAGTAMTASDTTTTRLAAPIGASVVYANSDANAQTDDPIPCATLSSKTVTIHDTETLNATPGPGVLIIVFGF